ncbi:MAG: MGMT family protein [Syntrophaceae bacterium]|nr:MGMT family protein [Deltaproteobacteria bacterium]
MIATLDSPSGPLWISGNHDAIDIISWEPLVGALHQGELDWMLRPLDAYFAGSGQPFPGGLVFLKGQTLWARTRREPVPETRSQEIMVSMTRIPYGATTTYGDLGASVGNRNLARAVGAVCRANPLPVLVPCHRVVGRATLGGFSAGISRKEFLLRLEGSLT